MPCFELFEDQDPKYRESVLPSDVRNRVACEAGIRQGWDRYLGDHGRFVGMSWFALGPIPATLRSVQDYLRAISIPCSIVGRQQGLVLVPASLYMPLSHWPQ